MNASKVFSSHEALPSDLERLYWHEWFGKLPPKPASLNTPKGPNKPEESSGKAVSSLITGVVEVVEDLVRKVQHVAKKVWAQNPDLLY